MLPKAAGSSPASETPDLMSSISIEHRPELICVTAECRKIIQTARSFFGGQRNGGALPQRGCEIHPECKRRAPFSGGGTVLHRAAKRLVGTVAVPDEVGGTKPRNPGGWKLQYRCQERPAL